MTRPKLSLYRRRPYPFPRLSFLDAFLAVDVGPTKLLADVPNVPLGAPTYLPTAPPTTLPTIPVSSKVPTRHTSTSPKSPPRRRSAPSKHRSERHSTLAAAAAYCTAKSLSPTPKQELQPDPKDPHSTTEPAPASKHDRLDKFYLENLGMKPSDIVEGSKGEPTVQHSSSIRNPIGKSPRPTHRTYDEFGPKLQWQYQLPTQVDLCTNGFGKPDTKHSFTQEASCETSLFTVLKSGYLADTDTTSLYAANPLIEHLDTMRKRLANYDFTWLRNMDTTWAAQKSISRSKSMAMMACLFHYNLDVSLLMRYLGNNYVAAHRNIEAIVERIRPFVSDELIQHYVRVMSVGCPNLMIAETSRENAMKYWRAGNNPSIRKKLDQVMKTMNKEERNNFVIPLPGWMWRFIPHLFFTPQHILEKLGKKDRQIFDAASRHDATSIPINMMTSTADGTELDCEFGDVLNRLLTRIWNLRITYPDKDIILHANDVKSCFRQLKHHPDVMGAFSYILGEYLFLQCGLTFGSDFSPANWEVVRRVAEKLAEGLFSDDSLRAKHRRYLDRLQWSRKLGKTATFSPAKADELNRGVLQEDGTPKNTPHAFFVDDDVYA